MYAFGHTMLILFLIILRRLARLGGFTTFRKNQNAKMIPQANCVNI